MCTQREGERKYKNISMSWGWGWKLDKENTKAYLSPGRGGGEGWIKKNLSMSLGDGGIDKENTKPCLCLFE